MQTTPPDPKESADGSFSPIASPILSMKSKVVLCLTTLLLFGCASEPITADWVSNQTQTTYDQFQKLSWATGPYIPYNDSQGYAGNLYLCIAKNASGGSEFLLGVENNSRTPVLFTSASSMTGEALTSQQTGEALSSQQTGEALSSQQMENHNDGVLFREKVRVILSKDLLIRCESSGLTIRLYGQQRNLDVTISAVYIQGFLRKTKT